MELNRIPGDEVAALAGVALATFRKHYSGERQTKLLDGLPAPAVRGCGRRPHLWIKQDILDWLESQRTFHSVPVLSQPSIEIVKIKRGPGRPRKMMGGE